MKTLTALLLVAFVAFVTGCGGGESTDDAANADADGGDMDMMDDDASGMSEDMTMDDDMSMDEDMTELDDAMQMDGDMDTENGDMVDAQTIMDSLDTTQEDDSDTDMDMDSDAAGDDMSDTEEEDK